MATQRRVAMPPGNWRRAEHVRRTRGGLDVGSYLRAPTGGGFGRSLIAVRLFSISSSGRA
jgi:hypothetical protein